LSCTCLRTVWVLSVFSFIWPLYFTLHL
jgi:hypothetical protein